MGTWPSLRHVLLGRDVAVGFAVVLAFYGLRYVGFPPVQIPAYLIIVAYDVVERLLPFLTPYHPVGFPLFMYLLAVAGASAGRVVRSDEEGGDAVVRAVGRVFFVLAALSLLFGASVGGPVLVPGGRPTPLAVTGATGIALVVAGWWLLARVGS
ncbi:hypothetical protein HSRCO_0384 [Halanaeroarchaeum sp. HSR-CO]|uniref:hypothetical protein n=1 Tax=Halanaeroarchaeum sp. HSR-CO TaxID=2866382 RepID=UPI00217D435C|nr:hypothetical protein [Halanaeroarchaeum sp. HSR-CO]UWG46682.1 hypothetical protein HSRCO_0384 [Halanaeroarchaeum sp. HSR-CO]